MKLVFWISGGIVLLGLLIFLFLVFKAKRKHSAIKHYEKIRDELTVDDRKIKDEELDYEKYSGMGLGNIVGGFVTILVGASLLPVISEQTQLALETEAVSNLTTGLIVPMSGATATIVKLIPILFVFAIIPFVWMILREAFHKTGLI